LLFDYSNRYFYGDGFGKGYQRLNLDDQTQHNHRRSTYYSPPASSK
jgi:hypothetical protein